MDFTFLGTSSAVPTKTRNVSGLALSCGSNKNWYLIDCGEATQHRIQHTNYSLNNLSAIFITHVHGDHCYGLPGLLASASMTVRDKPLTIVAPRQIQDFIEIVKQATVLGLSYEIEFIDVETLNKDWLGDDVIVNKVELSHRVPSYAYCVTEKNVEKKLLTEKLRQQGIVPSQVWGRLQNGEDVELDDGRLLLSDDYLIAHRKPRRIIIGGDNDTPELLQEASLDTQVLIHEATYTKDVFEQIGEGPQHSYAAKVAEFAQAANLPGLILTHFSPRYQENIELSPSIWDIENEAKAFYKGQLYLAQDLDKFNIDRYGHLHRQNSKLSYT